MYIHTMENYFTMRMNEVLIHATMWMEPESIMLSQRSQAQKTVHYDSIFMKGPEEVNPERKWEKGKVSSLVAVLTGGSQLKNLTFLCAVMCFQVDCSEPTL